VFILLKIVSVFISTVYIFFNLYPNLGKKHKKFLKKISSHRRYIEKNLSVGKNVTIKNPKYDGERVGVIQSVHLYPIDDCYIKVLPFGSVNPIEVSIENITHVK